MSDVTDHAAFPSPTTFPPSPDCHGEASLLLVESLIHSLVARSGLSLSEAIEIVQVAIDAQIEISQDRGDDPARLERSLALLSAIANSLAIDSDGSEAAGHLALGQSGEAAP